MLRRTAGRRASPRGNRSGSTSPATPARSTSRSRARAPNAEVVWRSQLVAAADSRDPGRRRSRTAAAGRRRSRSRSDDWRSGYYAVTLTAGDERADAFLVVRPAPGAAREPILLVLSTTTYERLQRLGRPVALHRRHAASRCERPMAPGFLRQARAAPPQDAAASPTARRRWFFEWAEPLGLSVWSGGAGWWNWERPFVQWAERNGFGVDVAISHGPGDTSRACSTATGCSPASATTSTGRGACARPSTRSPTPAATPRSFAATPASGRSGSTTTIAR